jgi:hypothetical protein
MMATPTVALLAEATFACATGKYNETLAPDEALQTLIEALGVLGAALSDSSRIVEHRKKVLQLIEGLLPQTDRSHRVTFYFL